LNRNQTLDVSRGFLSWIVVVVHVVWLAGYHGSLQRNAGSYAVDGFVILSGFVITQLLITKNEPYGVFIFRRFMRLFPAFIVCLAIALLVRPLTSGTAPTELVREASENRFFWWHLGAHASLIHGLVPTAWLPLSQMAFLPPGWSISLEFQLYLVAPLVLWWLARFGLRGFLVLAICSAVTFAPPIAWRLNSIWSAPGAFLPQRFLFFLVGMMLYLCARELGRKVTYWQGFVRLGEVSYSTYLVHWPILACLNIFLPLEWSRMVRAEVLFATGAPLTLLCSFLLYRYVECPGIALGRHLSKPKTEIKIGSAWQPLAQHGILQTWDSIRGALLRKLTEKYHHPPLSVKPRITMKIEDSPIPRKAEEPARFEAEEALTPLKVKAQISLEQSAGRRETGAEGI
jgi:peptidoglycan/LPS O-acetylase OafA/YrhL